jgi:RNA polymerase sigma factor (sigma-70 family)
MIWGGGWGLRPGLRKGDLGCNFWGRKEHLQSMTIDDAAASRRLMALLTPLHDRARATARRLCRSDAEGDDLFQETVLRAFDRLDELRDEDRFPAWFFAILLSVHRGRHRRHFWRRLLPLKEAREPARAAEADRVDGAERMTRALHTLAPKEREAIVLFEIEGFTLDEIAGIQGASLSAVKSRLARARARLRRHYEKDAATFGRFALEKTP